MLDLQQCRISKLGRDDIRGITIDAEHHKQFGQQHLAAACQMVFKFSEIEVHGIGKGINGKAVGFEGDRVAFDFGGDLLRGNHLVFCQGRRGFRRFSGFIRHRGLGLRGNQLFRNFFREVHHVKFFLGVFRVFKLDAYADRGLRFDLFTFKDNGNVIQAGQFHVVCIQGGRRLLPVGFPQFASFRNFLHPDFSALRNFRFRAVGHVNFIGQAVRGQHFLRNLRALHHAVDRERVGAESHRVDGFVVILRGLVRFCVGFDYRSFVVFNMDSLYVVFVRQFDHVAESNLYVHVRLGFQFFSVADEGNIKIPLQRDFAPLFVQRLVRQPAAALIFRRTGFDFPDNQLGFCRQSGFRTVGRGHHNVPFAESQCDDAGLGPDHFPVAEGFQPVIRDPDNTVFRVQNPGVVAGQEIHGILRVLFFLIGQDDLGGRKDFLPIRIGNGQCVKSASLICQASLPGIVLFVFECFVGGFHGAVEFRAFHPAKGKGRPFGNLRLSRILDQDAAVVCFGIQGSRFINGQVFRFRFGVRLYAGFGVRFPFRLSVRFLLRPRLGLFHGFGIRLRRRGRNGCFRMNRRRNGV